MLDRLTVTRGAGAPRSVSSCEPHSRLSGETRSRKSGVRSSEQWCPSCQQWLALEAFTPDRSACRRCHAAAMKNWRAENRDYVEQRNAQRRAEYRAESPLPTRPCAVCAEPFTGRPDAVVCGERCRSRRKVELRRLREPGRL